MATEVTRPEPVVPTPGPLPGLPDPWVHVERLLCQFTVELPLPGFRVADLLQLRPGSVIASRWQVGNDVPLRINGALIGWSEFEVVGSRLAVRLTELA